MEFRYNGVRSEFVLRDFLGMIGGSCVPLHMPGSCGKSVSNVNPSSASDSIMGGQDNPHIAIHQGKCNVHRLLLDPSLTNQLSGRENPLVLLKIDRKSVV